ncbi:putative ribosome-binding factor A [Morus notabilis]|uniref:Putative ribosome-binding factor A n=1 Tax=Morus notabilis TaxID=981085 RepID=W9QZJ2_9ROSA|nr:probable ribosome-binding factor A, chloroplastic [Morus notabilis]XP_024020900.1 probable ribosome-binding factor A, chloroplastic [Morus notabilis]EXB61806.1 putative ribosome-binding factor A [Morus notabilis]
MPNLVLHRPPLSPSLSHRHAPSSTSSSSVSSTSSLSFRFRTLRSTARIHPASHGAVIRCMAKPRRVAMVAKQIRRELSDMLLTDTTLQYAILPEAALGADRYLSSLTTISDVEVSSDLQVVKVYVSVFGDERRKEVALAGLKSKAKYVRSELGRRMKLRLTPEIRFIEDESLERGSRVIAILDKIKNEKKTAVIEDDEEIESSDAPQDDGDWESDDPDEDIIYVK